MRCTAAAALDWAGQFGNCNYNCSQLHWQPRAIAQPLARSHFFTACKQHFSNWQATLLQCCFNRQPDHRCCAADSYDSAGGVDESNFDPRISGQFGESSRPGAHKEARTWRSMAHGRPREPLADHSSCCVCWVDCDCSCLCLPFKLRGMRVADRFFSESACAARALLAQGRRTYCWTTTTQSRCSTPRFSPVSTAAMFTTSPDNDTRERMGYY